MEKDTLIIDLSSDKKEGDVKVIKFDDEPMKLSDEEKSSLSKENQKVWDFLCQASQRYLEWLYGKNK